MCPVSLSDQGIAHSFLEAPFADERNRYLRHCEAHGARPAVLAVKRRELLYIAIYLTPDAAAGAGMADLLPIAHARQSVRGASTAARRIIDIGRPWLKFLGWWREPPVPSSSYQAQLDQYVAWMRDDRGFTPSTVEQWERLAGAFLLWCDETNRRLQDLKPEDVDCYFATQGLGRWSRVSVAHIAAALRAFLRFAANQAWCSSRMPGLISRPRIYRQETLPYAPAWSDVQKMVADADTDHPRDIRDRAILLLLSVYGLRRGEIVALRLEHIDWTGRTLRIFRLKRRQPQLFPLVPEVAEALARYIDTVRPPSSSPEVFLRMQAPWRLLTASSIYHIANRRFVARGIQAAHRGSHALRHACAVRLLAEGLTIKEIGDHLGHHSTAATSTYAKVDITALRQVGAFDLGAVL